MNETPGFISILIAEDNMVSSEMMAALLEGQGYKTHKARDGNEAIAIIRKHDVDLALVDINMAPTGGFEFIKHLLVQGIKIPVVIVTADESTDMLVEATSLGVRRILHKPLEPKRLLDTVFQILKRQGLNPSPLAVEKHEERGALSHEQLMQRAIDLARKNAESGKGRPFGAVVSDGQGHILGEGSNGFGSRIDPTAHAEVMAIRHAAERLGREDLSDCVLYASSEPTMMGKALIVSVGIPKVFYGASHEDVRTLSGREDDVRSALSKGIHQGAEYVQMAQESARAMLKKFTQ